LSGSLDRVCLILIYFFFHGQSIRRENLCVKNDLEVKHEAAAPVPGIAELSILDVKIRMEISDNIF